MGSIASTTSLPIIAQAFFMPTGANPMNTCPQCQSSDIHPIPTHSPMNPNRSQQAIQQILSYAAIGASVGKHIKGVPPVAGRVIGAAAGALTGIVVISVIHQYRPKQIVDDLFGGQSSVQRYECGECGWVFENSN